MADPICRWRNPYIDTVRELIDILPKEELRQVRAREIINERSPYDFFRTPYQLACQLGLYYEYHDHYFPKFKFTPTEPQVRSYLENWIIHYCVPNPYTRGFDELAPFSIHAEICRRLLQTGNNLNWNELRDDIFGIEIGNNDILVNSINTYSPVIIIDHGEAHLKLNKTYEELVQYTTVDVIQNRNNAEYFFDLFSVPGIDVIENDIVLPQSIQQDYELINQVQNQPGLSQTEKNQIVAARIGQGYFRRNLILENGYCPISLVDDPRFLIAGHIKPWRDSDNQERVNYKNGILLAPNFDRLFDKGFISFTNNRSLMISPHLSAENAGRFGLVPEINLPHLIIEGREAFLEYHRNHIFKH